MINHYVFFKVKSEYNKAEKEAAIKEITEALKKLPTFIDEIEYYEVITNIKDEGADIGLISKFRNLTELELYRKHPKHIEVINIITKHKESGTFIDYEKAESIFEKKFL